METSTRSDDLKKLTKLIADMKFCMLTTADAQGRLHSRPMAVNRPEEFDGTLWFFTYAHSLKTAEVERDHHVNVSFADPGKNDYVSMTGMAQLVRDRAEMERRWTPALKAWFPKGVDEPDIGLLRVTVEAAEYWDAPSSVVAHAISLAKAAVTGKPANPAENKRVELS